MSPQRGEPRPDSCSMLWDDPTLPAWGTTPQASFIVALQQEGAWGAKAIVESDLGADLGAALDAAVTAAGGRLQLIRSVGRPGPYPGRRILVAGGLVGRGWLLGGDLTDPAQVLDWPLASFGDADPPAVPGLVRSDSGVLLVCTNGKRDECCAVRGRPLALDLAAVRPGEVWETTHLGGHRFAPTVQLLPTGQLLGRVDAALASTAVVHAARGECVAAGEGHDRGRPGLSQRCQVAEAYLRERVGVLTPGDVSLLDDGEVIAARHADGRSWSVRVWREHRGSRVESCGAEAVQAWVWRAGGLEEPGG